MPLYVLIDRGSGSAAEHVPFVLQNLTAEYVGAQGRPAAVPPERLAQHAGRYSGGRIVTAEGGRLFYQAAEDEPRRELLPLGAGRFAAGPTVRIEFAPGADGRMQLRLSSPGERPRAFDRLP